MKIFRIDTLPLSEEILFANDYTSKIVYSSTADTLFKYDKKTNSIIKNACFSYMVEYKYKKHTFVLRDDLFFYNGQKITAEDYYNSFIKILNSKSYSGFVLNEVKDIKYDNNKLIFFLKYSNKSFYKKLSIFNFSCIKGEFTSGPYYILKRDNNSIIVKRNKYYRKEIEFIQNELINFQVSTEYIKDLGLFMNKKLDITNNTMFPYEKIKEIERLLIDENYIFMCLNFNVELLSEKGKKIRKKIKETINREKIKMRLNDCVYSAEHFFLNDRKTQKNTRMLKHKKIKKPIVLTLGYDDFHPNKIIAEEIKKQLQEVNIFIELKKNDYGKTNDNDINLKLSYAEFIDNSSFYTSFLFQKISNSKKYLRLVRLYGIIPLDILLNLMDNYIIKNAFKIPLLKMKSIYLCDDTLRKFNFQEFNYQDL